MKNNIVLIGMMGSGKTTVAKELSKLIPEYSLSDIDEEIEKSTGKKISDIFLKYGEAHFRNLEKDKIEKISQKQNQIISLGGGAFENEENRTIILNSSITIYLKTSPQEIFSRVKNEFHRPLLQKNCTTERITELIKKREPNYLKADIIITTDNKKPEDIAQEILGVIKCKI